MPNIKLVLHSVHFSRQYRSSHQRCSMKKGVLKNFAKLTGKYLCQSLFFIKVAGAACNFIKKEILAQVFSCGFCEISKNTLFTEHLWVTASGGKDNFETSLWDNPYPILGSFFKNRLQIIHNSSFRAIFFHRPVIQSAWIKCTFLFNCLLCLVSFWFYNLW